MKRLYTAVYFLISISFFSLAQTPVNHWETAVYDSSSWMYFPGVADPGSEWKNSTYAEELWLEGKGGFGYGDGDDETIIENSNSVFLRKKFTVTNNANLVDAILHVDYDDGFVAYLNGVEIARANMSQPSPAYNDFSATTHEAVLNSNVAPESFQLTADHLNLLQDGENVIAIQVHNSDAASSDLTLRAFLSFGISNDATYFSETPSWFPEPLVFKSSNLPILVINTHGQAIMDDFGIVADLGIIDNGAGNRNNTADSFNDYKGKITIETRGESSQMFPKKSYKIETQSINGYDSAASLLGMPKEADWVLYAPYTDKTMIRNVLTFALGNKMGNYSSRTRFCEVILNGEYIGVYVLMEKIKQDKNRVNIDKLSTSDIKDDDLTGGYILRVDKIDANDYPGWESVPVPQLPNENNISFQFFDPDGDVLAEEQKQYIKDYILDFQSSLTQIDFSDPKYGYKKYIDLPSFVDYILISEVSKNVDAYIFSTYMHKDKDSNGGKLKMGPLWDYNLAYGNVDYHQNSQVAPGWIFNDNYRMFWFRRMINDPDFASSFSCRYFDLRKNILSLDSINKLIDFNVQILDEAQERNYQKWPILSTYIWPNQFVGNSYEGEITFLKDWIKKRLEWMDINMPKTCETTPPTAIEEEMKEPEILIYPNPSLEGYNFSFKRTAKASKIEIYSLSGELLYSSRIKGNSFFWSTELNNGNMLSQGLYLFKIYQEKKVVSGKIVKQ